LNLAAAGGGGFFIYQVSIQEGGIDIPALYFMQYNFCRIHQTLRVTPAMEAAIADHVWTMEEIVNLIDG
jgi:hypothetical protein